MESAEQLSSERSQSGTASRPLRIVVLGMMGRMPLAGVVWQVLHYLEGFRRLGFDVYYVEDTGAWPYNPEENTVASDSSYSIGLLRQVMANYGFSDRWAYRDVMRGGSYLGLSEQQIQRLFEQTDILINLTASTVLRAEHLRVPVRVYLETDPVLPQIEVAKGNSSYLEHLARTRITSPMARISARRTAAYQSSFRYLPTRQPVILDWWIDSSGATTAPRACFTTIANWSQSGKDFDWNGERYTWSKHHEFLKFLELPKRVAEPLELALALKSGAGTEKTVGQA